MPTCAEREAGEKESRPKKKKESIPSVVLRNIGYRKLHRI